MDFQHSLITNDNPIRDSNSYQAKASSQNLNKSFVNLLFI